MRLRTVRFVIQLTVSFTLVGCNDSGKQPVTPPATKPGMPAPPPTAAPHVQIQPLTADQLAQIMGVNVLDREILRRTDRVLARDRGGGAIMLPKRIPPRISSVPVRPIPRRRGRSNCAGPGVKTVRRVNSISMRAMRVTNTASAETPSLSPGRAAAPAARGSGMGNW